MLVHLYEVLYFLCSDIYTLQGVVMNTAVSSGQYYAWSIYTSIKYCFRVCYINVVLYFCVVIFIHCRVLLLILRYYVGSIMNEVYTPVINTAVLCARFGEQCRAFWEVLRVRISLFYNILRQHLCFNIAVNLIQIWPFIVPVDHSETIYSTYINIQICTFQPETNHKTWSLELGASLRPRLWQNTIFPL